MYVRLILLLAMLPLVGCMETLKGSVAGSCAVFERPPYAVRGKTPYDQQVADNFVESGVAGCNWQRPAVRPAVIDAPAGRKAAVRPKKGLMRQIHDRLLPATSAAEEQVFPVAAPPVLPTPQPPAVTEPVPIDTPAPRVRSPIERLLQPRDDD